ncbi:uncharacterized protein [Panulirus ornatus]|uniref:uncharacterized protein n=1 Tax=Panulirus ornatus TaxID=150431 RepID=UPI003A8A844D
MEATSNWSTENNVRIHESIQESTTFPSGSLVELLDEDKCISLIQPISNKSEECYIRLGSKLPGQTCVWPKQQGMKRNKLVSGIMLLSEARIVEVYVGLHDEYCKTVHGKLMGSFDDSRIFKCEVHLDCPKEMVMLKLKATCHVESLWVYGFHVTTSMEPAIQSGGRFSSDHLSLVLKDKDVLMSDPALKFCQMLEDFNNSNDSDGPFHGNSPMALMSMMFSTMKSTPKSTSSSFDLENKLDFSGKKIYMGTGIDNSHGKQTQDSLRENTEECDLEKGENLPFGDLCSDANIQEIKHILEDKMKNLEPNYEHKNCKENEGKSDQTDKESIRNLKELVVLSNNLVNSSTLMCDGSNSTNKPQQGNQSGTGCLVNKVPDSSKDQHLSKGSDENFGLREAEKNVVQCSEMHEGNRKVSTKENRDLLIHFEKVIDKKFAEMEERLIEKIEQKLSEKAKENSAKLERIEELLSKFFDIL